METQTSTINGRLVVFLLGQTGMSLTSLEALKYKSTKSSPNYPDVIPSQWSITSCKSIILDHEIGIHVKAYQPDIIVFEASVFVDDLLSDFVFDLKRELIPESCTKTHLSSMAVEISKISPKILDEHPVR